MSYGPTVRWATGSPCSWSTERDDFTVAWGVRRAGLRGVPVNWHLTAAEVAYMVDNSDAVALIVSAGLIDVAEEVRKSNDRLASA